MKLLFLLLVSTLPASELRRHAKRLKAIEWIGKWSMHDVLVLALTIFFLKSQGVYDAASLPAVYYFTTAVALMILSYAWLKTDVAAAGHLYYEPQVAEAAFGRAQLSAELPHHPRDRVLRARHHPADDPLHDDLRVDKEHSIATIIYALYDSDEYFLCAVVFAVSIFFPFLKLFYLLTLVTSPDLSPEFRRRSFSTMEWLGRYSMTDVMVLALMIFYVNSSGYTEAIVMPGVYFFAASAHHHHARLRVGQYRAAATRIFGVPGAAADVGRDRDAAHEPWAPPQARLSCGTSRRGIGRDRAHVAPI